MGSPLATLVRPLSRADAAWARSELEQSLGFVVRRPQRRTPGRLFPRGVVASVAGADIGLLTVANRGPDYEVVSISTALEGAGVGRALMQRAI